MRRLVFALAAAAAMIGAAAQAQAPLTAESMWRLARLGGPVIAPDGAAAVVQITRVNPETESRESDLHLIDTRTGAARQLTADANLESDPAWSPDGRWIAFTARRDGDFVQQIYVMPAAGGAARRVTALPTGARKPHWLGDSNRIAFLTRIWPDLSTWEAQAARIVERGASRMTARVWDRAPISYWDEWLDDRQWHLFIVGREGGAPAAVTLGAGHSVFFQEPGAEPFDVSPSGSEIAFTADVDPSPEINLDVLTIAQPGAPARNITAANLADDFEPLYAPNGRAIAYLSQRILGFYNDRQRLTLYERASRRTRIIADDWDRSAAGLVWAAGGDALYGAIDDAGVRRVHRIGLDGARAPVTAGSDFSNLQRGGETLIALRQSFAAPPEIVRIDPASGAVTPLTRVNDEALAQAALGRTESVTYPGANGAPIQMWVTYPPGFDPAREYPLLLLLHGGPHNAVTDSWTWRWNAQVFAGWGYVVAWHNFHGSSGFGQAFADSINPNRADLPYQDTIRATDWFAAQPWIDRERMVAAGGSYGGYLAAVLMGREHPFKAFVAHAAVYNNYSQIAADYGAERDRFFQYWERPEEFQRYSPHMAAANFRTPTLVIHGGLDRRVPANHGVELFNTLQIRGVPSRLIYYPNENHWVLNAQNSIFWYAEVRRWIERYAPPGPDAPPAQAAPPVGVGN